MSIRLTVALLLAAPAAATVATPATLDAVLARAAPGETITLAAGSYGPLRLRDRHWERPVTIEAAAAQLRGNRFDHVSGMTWHGGSFDGGDTEHSGFNVHFADHLVVDGATFRHFTGDGIEMGQVADIRITNNTITDSGSDGIDIAASRRVVLDHNRCVDFHPVPGAHPDCIQLWSEATQPPTADIAITNNEAVGDMQGFTGFDGPKNGVEMGGFERIMIEHNVVKVSSWHGIAIYNCRHCVVRHNRASSLPNPTYPQARAWIKVINGVDTIDCDNRAVDYPNEANRQKCKRGT